ncbi:putative phosphatidylinositol-3,4,5-trisphosphate 3-phosphatase [Aspergillus chevalieri]|uniref:phosphatidylinositol-3,4,5-trisphosphate 3-phosphatase n=1 Tax=Aspergillus chevalieri TaxID=182096 RepID=A0A7R7VPJ7_ASPCH|nr:uncharacterized protein ACHE_40906A [Aspergillus chevalieri]BCR88342.1 hypothetical protein ACHE_40906A [Aspergillus chevalieri]
MASILRQIVAGPRLQHPEAGLDLCYVTDDIIATSGPSLNFPKRAYRNPLDALVNFLDSKHGSEWCIWEFRAEGTGYPDSEVYGRIHHFPWPDHHPPPFALIPAMMASMRNWVQRLDDSGSKDTDENGKPSGKGKRVAVVHCKAGKGRSGTVACSYLISEQGWKLEDALQRFTERRMRSGFGAGVSIPSQLRWVGYVDRWAKSMNKKYVERPVEILEIHVWGLRDGVKVAIEGFVEEGKQIKCYHLFHRSEKTVVDDGKTLYGGKNGDGNGKKKDDNQEPLSAVSATSPASLFAPSTESTVTSQSSSSTPTKRINAILLRPSKPVILPSSDVNIDFERRSKAAYTGWAMVTSIAHIWFNAYFEGGDQHTSNVFEADWEALDGIKGTTKKGVRALDRLKVVWRYPPPSELGLQKDTKGGDVIAPVALGQTVTEPKPGEPIPETEPADWRGQHRDPSDGPLREHEQEMDKENLVPRERIAEATDHQHERGSKGLTVQTEHPWLTGASTAAATAASATLHSFHGLEKELGLRKQTDESQDVSLANSEDELGPGKTRNHKAHVGAAPGAAPSVSVEDSINVNANKGNGDLEGVQAHSGNKADKE